jgi:nicotinamide-nucleotide amidase
MEQSIFNLEQINRIKSVLAQRSETIAVGESVTGGLLQFALSSADGAREYFQGGITAYNLGQKSRHLHIEPIHAESCDCVSEKVAQQMALYVTTLFQSDWGIAITGYASPAPESGGELFAYFCIVKRGAVVSSGRLNPGTSGFPDVQLEYVNKVVEELSEDVRSES